jgi:hypothetical protein
MPSAMQYEDVENSAVNPLNAELNPVCHLLALLGAHPILHVSGINVKYKALRATICEENMRAADAV